MFTITFEKLKRAILNFAEGRANEEDAHMIVEFLFLNSLAASIIFLIRWMFFL